MASSFSKEGFRGRRFSFFPYSSCGDDMVMLNQEETVEDEFLISVPMHPVLDDPAFLEDLAAKSMNMASA